MGVGVWASVGTRFGASARAEVRAGVRILVWQFLLLKMMTVFIFVFLKLKVMTAFILILGA
jgi:hypothetical protein